MKPLLCFDLWNTLAQEPLTSQEYFAPLWIKYPAVSPAQVSVMVDEIVMRQPMELAQGVREILQQLDIDDYAMVKEITKRWESSCRQATLFPDVAPCLTRLRTCFVLAMITNTSKYGWEQLESKYKLSDYFDAVCLSWKAGLVKPDLRIFQAVAQKTGTAPKLCTMIGDSETIDLVPARALGWKTQLIVRGGRVNVETTAIRSLYELYTNVLIR